MKIALIGATGTIGSRIATEALNRGHQVTAVLRDPSRAPKGTTGVYGNMHEVEALATAFAGNDVVISAYSPGLETPAVLLDSTRNLIAAVKESGVPRVIAVGGAGGLQVAPGVALSTTEHFPEAWREIADAHDDALEIYRAEPDLNWTKFSPAAMIEPGERTGKYRSDTENLVVDSTGNSAISAEDYAVALIDEVETPKHERRRFTVGY